MLNRTRKGMTLLELIVVIVILGILAAIAIPTFEAVIGKAKDQAAVTAAQALDHEAMALAGFDLGTNPTAAPNDGTGILVSGYTYVAGAAADSSATVTYAMAGPEFNVASDGSTACWVPSSSPGTSGAVTAGACS